ncbi:Bug family tripartite tricarboxylate transporter substrate binding protein [Belnapia rosea]|uniref:Tripartite-type tricarboxylate transporter, receptor component TctC n=1 Tax=Belnapia rosea TaxID=938405 RepID=A0A1G6JAZ0_9PROT|nr:tripartite tricarboxylate transporter substrate-binding protein [Belnapia rosea]SDC15954.1 Tripartite-type tricarboxylate transporter, receptor component TctC [Belnapia rosea]
MIQIATTRRRLLQAGSLLAMPAPALAQPAYPNRPLSLLIGYAPGGLTDVMVRMIAERLGRELGQTVVVENRSGGATSIASTAVAQARPDGYTLLIGTNSLAINLALQPGLTPRDPMRELQPVGEVYYTPFALAVHSSVPVQDFKGLIDYARANPGKLNYGSSGSGSVNHLLTELLMLKSGARFEHVPYRGAGPALIDLRANRIQVFYASPLDAEPLVKEGIIRLVAISSEERLASLPDLPSVAESFPGCAGVLWQGLFVPPGTPPEVQARLHAALRASLADPALASRVVPQGVVIMPGDAAALRDRLAREIKLWAEVIPATGIKAE